MEINYLGSNVVRDPEHITKRPINESFCYIFQSVGFELKVVEKIFLYFMSSLICA